MNLHDITSNPDLYRGAKPGWCGPAAISAITGRSRQCANAWMLFDQSRMPNCEVRGSTPDEVRRALRHLGYVMLAPSHVEGKPTLAQWLRGRTASQRTWTYLVIAANHWIVVRGNKAVCGLTGKKVPTSKAKKRRGRVVAVYPIAEQISQRAVDVRAKRLDPMPVWSDWSDRIGRRAQTRLTLSVIDTRNRLYGKRPYPKNHEVPSPIA